LEAETDAHMAALEIGIASHFVATQPPNRRLRPFAPLRQRQSTLSTTHKFGLRNERLSIPEG